MKNHARFDDSIVTVDVIAIAHGACDLSFVISKKDMKAALVAAPREFQLGEPNSPMLPTGSADRPVAWVYESRRASADAD
jgi:hypothetical protein